MQPIMIFFLALPASIAAQRDSIVEINLLSVLPLPSLN